MRLPASRVLAALTGMVAAVLLAGPVKAQETQGDGPKSLLPGQFAAPPPPAEVDEAAPVVDTPEALPGLPGQAEAPPQKPISGTLPRYAESGDAQRIGTLGPGRGYADPLWAGTSGAGASALLAGLPAQLSTRAGYQALRRLLGSRALAPEGMTPPDFAAQRIRRLLVAGDVKHARALVGAVPLTRYSRELYGAATQTHLAAMDMSAVCPLVPGGQTISNDSLWTLMSAICRALQGDEQGAALELDRAREKRTIHPVDLQVTDRLVIGIGSNARGGSLTLGPADRLTTFRLAAAMVAGTPPPPALIDKQPAAVRAWLARTPLVTASQRRSAVETAATLGILTRKDVQHATAALSSGLDPAAFARTPAGLARTALAARTPSARAQALRGLWAAAKTPEQLRFHALLGAPAAAALKPQAASAAIAGTAGRMLVLAGQPKPLFAWWPVLRKAARTDADAGASLLELWPHLLVLGRTGTIVRPVELAQTWYKFHGDEPAAVRDRRAALFAAVLDGVGLGFPANTQDDLPRAMRSPKVATTAAREAVLAAARDGKRGEVMVRALRLLGGAPLAVDPNDVRAALAALRSAGFGGEARLIGAELLALNGV